uniref:Uncharacterized protein n=1 Tax=Arundo donax TaxID=35708 RepID=A0A0A9DTS4_ARUDO
MPRRRRRPGPRGGRAWRRMRPRRGGAGRRGWPRTRAARTPAPPAAGPTFPRRRTRSRAHPLPGARQTPPPPPPPQARTQTRAWTWTASPLGGQRQVVEAGWLGRGGGYIRGMEGGEVRLGLAWG